MVQIRDYTIRTVNITFASRPRATVREPSRAPYTALIWKAEATAVKNCVSPCDGAVAYGTQQTYKLSTRAVATCCELVGLIFSTRDTIVRRIGLSWSVTAEAAARSLGREGEEKKRTVSFCTE